MITRPNVEEEVLRVYREVRCERANPHSHHPLIKDYYYIIVIERRDFGGIMSNDCKNTLHTQNSTSARRSRTSEVFGQSIYQIQRAAELSESGKLRAHQTPEL